MSFETIRIPINDEFDVTPDSLYPQTPQYMNVEYYEMDLDDFVDFFYDYLVADCKEGDTRPFDTPEFDKFCNDYNINKKKVEDGDNLNEIAGVVLLNGADVLFNYMPDFKTYFIYQKECDIVDQEEERREQAEFEAQMAEQEAEAKAFEILRKLLPNIVKTEVIEAKNEGFIFIAKFTKIYVKVKQGTIITNEELDALENFRITVEVE